MRYLPVLLAVVPTLALCAPEPLQFLPSPPSLSGKDIQSSPSATQGGFIPNLGCTCVPVSQCNFYDVVRGHRGSKLNRGRPSYGQVGHGIEPRSTLEEDLERNATGEEAAPLTMWPARALTDDADAGAPASNRIRRAVPPVMNGPSNSCVGRQVCCRYPQRPDNKNPNYNLGGPSSSPTPLRSPKKYQNNKGICGTRNAFRKNSRVRSEVHPKYGIGKVDTDFGEYPWQVAILRKDGRDNVFVCGGSLLDSGHVITAAHCIHTRRPENLRVRLGDWDVGGDTEFYPHQDLDVVAIALHPDFNSGNLFNDLALIKLDGPVDLGRSPHISPICLPDKYYEFNGKRCIATGWGKDAWGLEGKFQHRLQQVDLPVLHHADCEQKLQRSRLGSNFVLHPGFLCAGGEANRDVCQGDGGGPLACEIRGVWQLAGVTSWGVSCAQPYMPGVYVKISNYLDWIKRNVGYTK